MQRGVMVYRRTYGDIWKPGEHIVQGIGDMLIVSRSCLLWSKLPQSAYGSPSHPTYAGTPLHSCTRYDDVTFTVHYHSIPCIACIGEGYQDSKTRSDRLTTERCRQAGQIFPQRQIASCSSRSMQREFSPSVACLRFLYIRFRC